MCIIREKMPFLLEDAGCWIIPVKKVKYVKDEQWLLTKFGSLLIWILAILTYSLLDYILAYKACCSSCILRLAGPLLFWSVTFWNTVVKNGTVKYSKKSSCRERFFTTKWKQMCHVQALCHSLSSYSWNTCV